MKTWDERLTEISAKLNELSEKTETAAKKAKDVREVKEAVVKEEISNIKGVIAAFEEQARINREEGMSRLGSELIKAKMTLKAKIEDQIDTRDKALLEVYMDERAISVMEYLDLADYMVANAMLNYLELADAFAEYDERFGEKEAE